MTEEETQSEDYLALSEWDIEFKQRLAKILSLLGMEESYIEEIMAEVQNRLQLDYLLEKIGDMTEEVLQPLKSFLVQCEESYAQFDKVHKAVETMQTASGLTEEQAKTCVYYATATYGLEDLSIFPILVFQGALATGKSTAIKALKQLTYKPEDIGTGLSRASIRDKLAKFAKNSVAFFEEGDGAAEDIISNRYSRETAATSVKRANPEGGWHNQELSYFGASVLHKRRAFSDPATASRTIVIRTRYNPGDYHVTEVGQDVRDALKGLWAHSTRGPAELECTGRAADVWAPLIAAAQACDDIHWCIYALEQIGNGMPPQRIPFPMLELKIV